MSYFNIMENIFFTLKSVKGSPVFSFTGIPLLLDGIYTSYAKMSSQMTMHLT